MIAELKRTSSCDEQDAAKVRGDIAEQGPMKWLAFTSHLLSELQLLNSVASYQGICKHEHMRNS